jgi:two-component system NarL family sensor kinase
VNAPVVAAVALGVSSAVSGWFIVQGSRARLAGAALLVGGILALTGCAAIAVDLAGVAPTAFRAAGCLAIPAALIFYPRPDWKDPLSFVLTVVVLAGGALCVVWPAAIEPMGYVLVSALLVHAWWAFERGVGDARRAMIWCALAWIGAGLTAAFAGFVLESANSGWDVTALAIALLVPGPLAMVIGALRPEVVDVRGLVTRSVVAGTVLTTYVASAVGLTAIVEQLRGRPLESPPTIVLCAVLAFGVRPLQIMLRGVVDQLLFGDRPDPLAAATSLADRIGDDPVLALDAIREALVIPYASLRVGGELLASSGSEVTHTRVLPLRLGDDSWGEVVVGLRAGDLSLSSADEDVLRIVAPLLAQTLRARGLARDLRESRGAAITAIEEERRRLRRDLHDGLGPTMSGVAFAADAARNMLANDPAAADELLASLRADTASAIEEIRRLVYGLRPPALDELGLVGAVRQHASSLYNAAGTPLDVEVSAPEPMPDLSAATEVASYRIVVEALTNVVRHASASRAHVDLTVERGVMHLAVQDDGTSTEAWRPGVGIASMKERAEQVGGTLAAGGGDHGGRVTAAIPL